MIRHGWLHFVFLKFLSSLKKSYWNIGLLLYVLVSLSLFAIPLCRSSYRLCSIRTSFTTILKSSVTGGSTTTAWPKGLIFRHVHPVLNRARSYVRSVQTWESCSSARLMVFFFFLNSFTPELISMPCWKKLCSKETKRKFLCDLKILVGLAMWHFSFYLDFV